MTNDKTPLADLLSRRAMKGWLRVSDTTLDAMIADGVLPPGIPFGKRKRWSRQAITDRLQSRLFDERVGNKRAAA